MNKELRTVQVNCPSQPCLAGDPRRSILVSVTKADASKVLKGLGMVVSMCMRAKLDDRSAFSRTLFYRSTGKILEMKVENG